ncbi:hypothetical protein GCM10022415_14670 [Knoellia locipacati]|uniref:Gingipain domain-containing protein n=1 Tax=Knoellia locipacati TaxID=882824 RepID=A0A512SZP1_9MICO|nr:C25 family cysteine peptidase [Knoellia locipacati]GEQ13418.1 hypothetical protein KLO01_14650 [Knoellia locipacati]
MKVTSERRDDRIVTTVEISPEEVSVRETPFGAVVDVPELSAAGQPGAPALPRTRIAVGVPPDSWPTSLEVEEGEWVTVAKGVVVPVSQPQAGLPPKGRGKGDPHRPGSVHCSPDCDCRSGHRPGGEGEGPLVEGFDPPTPTVPDPEAYRRAVEEPPPVGSAAGVEPLPGLRAASVELSPVRQTKDGTIELCTSFRVSVAFSGEPTIADRDESAKLLAEELGRDIDPERLVLLPDGPRELSATDLELARSRVVNPDIFDTIEVILRQLPSEYLVITDDRTWDAARIEPVGDRPGLVEAFQELARLKRARGISARVVTITDIVDGVHGDFRHGSRDLQEVIRRFLKVHRERWGVRWLVLGGDIETVPTRTVTGGCRGTIDTTATNPPEDNRSFWTGGHLRMNVTGPGEWWGASTANILTRPDTGQLIPYDPAGTSSAASPGWFFTNSSYTMRQTTPSQYVRVNGPAALVNAQLQWHYHWNQLPTDFYYASLQGWYWGTRRIDVGWFSFVVPWVYEPDHDWDVRDNGVYGQCTVGGQDLDGVHLSTELSVGRIPVDTADEARGYVAKVAAYESLDSPWGPLVDQFSGSMLLASSSWGGPQWIWPTPNPVPAGGQYSSRADHSLVRVGTVPTSWDFELVSHVSDTDRRVLPMKSSTNPATRGWYYARSETDLSRAEVDLFFFTLPYRTSWIVVHGSQVERRPQAFQVDWTGQDGSMADQETLRRQVDVGIPGITSFRRAYEDEQDLSWWERFFGGPVRYLTSAVLRDELERSPALVSLSGHGNGDGCCGGSVGLARSLTNGPLCFVGYADSCLTSEFDSDDAFGEALLANPDGGAVGYVGNSRFSWIGIGDDFQRAFFSRLTTTRHLGLLNDTRVSVAAASSPNAYWRWPVLTLNLLGDPELRVRRQARRPLRFDIVQDLTRLRVTTVDGLAPVPGASVRVSAGRSVVELVTDGDGWVDLDVRGLEKAADRGGLSVAVSHEDFEPVEGELASARE